MHVLCGNKSVTAELLQCMHTYNPDAAKEKNKVSTQRYLYTSPVVTMIVYVRYGMVLMVGNV